MFWLTLVTSWPWPWPVTFMLFPDANDICRVSILASVVIYINKFAVCKLSDLDLWPFDSEGTFVTILCENCVRVFVSYRVHVLIEFVCCSLVMCFVPMVVCAFTVNKWIDYLIWGIATLGLVFSFWYMLVKMLSVWKCLDVNQAGTNHNHCTQRLVILH